MADRWYLKGIHVPVNRFGSEENKKTGIAYKPDGTCLQQTFFFTVREKIKGGNLKGHPYFLKQR